MTTMRVLPVPGVAVLDYAFGKAHGKRRFVGRKAVRVTDAELRAAKGAGCSRAVGFMGEHALPAALADCDVVRECDPVEPGDEYFVEAWVRKDSPVEVPADGDGGSYFKARVREGGLLPADEATAALCGVPFKAAKPAGKAST